MIVLLSTYSISWSQNDTINQSCDSALICIDAIKVANAKMIELKYEKEINENLIEVIRTDSILINALETNLEACEEYCEEEVKKYKEQRNKAIIAGSGSSLLLLVLLILAL